MSHLQYDFDPHLQGDVQNPTLLSAGECTAMTWDSQLTPPTSPAIPTLTAPRVLREGFHY